MARRRPPIRASAVAVGVGVSQGAVSKWLAGLTTPKPEQCQRIAHFFRAPEEEVLHAAGHLSGTVDHAAESLGIVPELIAVLERMSVEAQLALAFALTPTGLDVPKTYQNHTNYVSQSVDAVPTNIDNAGIGGVNQNVSSKAGAEREPAAGSEGDTPAHRAARRVRPVQRPRLSGDAS